MINIAYIVSTLKRSGPTNQLSYIVKYLDKEKFKPIIITLSNEPSDTLVNKFNDLGIEHISLNLSRLEGFFKAKNKIMMILNEKKIDIVHTQGIRADIISAKYLKDFKRVSTLRNYPYEDYPMKFGNLRGKLMAFKHISATKKIKNSIACSQSISNMYKKNHSIFISYIQNGVDEKLFERSIEKDKLKEKLNLSRCRKIFISVGSLIPRKDPLTIINAFNEMKDSSDRELVFLGDGFIKNDCIETANKNKYIKFIGNVDNVSEYLLASDYFISASKSEGLPNTVIEAMASGLPCILSDIEPHNEILSYDSSIAKIFQIENKNDLISKINEIEKLDYETISKNSIKLINNNLTAEIMSQKYQKLYIDIL